MSETNRTMRNAHPPPARITDVRVVGGRHEFRVELTFTDGLERVIDLEPFLYGPVFEPLREDQDLFRKVAVDPELGTIVWPNGADLDPDVLHAGGTPAWALEAIRKG